MPEDRKLYDWECDRAGDGDGSDTAEDEPGWPPAGGMGPIAGRTRERKRRT